MKKIKMVVESNSLLLKKNLECRTQILRVFLIYIKVNFKFKNCDNYLKI